MLEEKWRNIKNHPNYLVSDLGRIKSLAITKTNSKGKAMSYKEKIIGNKVSNAKGYICVVMIDEIGIKKSHRVHRLVAEAFIDNPLNLPQVNHKNTIKTDNRSENLEWCDNDFNKSHAMNNNLIPKGEGAPNVKLSESDVIAIKNQLKNQLKSKDIALAFGVHPVTISDIKRHKNWKHIII